MKRTFSLDLGSETVELYFDNEALYEFEEVHGETAIDVLNTGKIGFRAITHFVWAGTLHNRKYTLQQIKKMINPNQFERIVGVLVKAIESALDTGEQGKGETVQEA